MNFIYGFIKKRIREIGYQIGETCPYWFNDEIYNAIFNENKEKEEALKEKYIRQCHEPYAIYKPNSKEMIVLCSACDLSNNIKCDRIFPGIAEIWMKEFIGVNENDNPKNPHKNSLRSK